MNKQRERVDIYKWHLNHDRDTDSSDAFLRVHCKRHEAPIGWRWHRRNVTILSHAAEEHRNPNPNQQSLVMHFLQRSLLVFKQLLILFRRKQQLVSLLLLSLHVSELPNLQLHDQEFR